MDEIAEALLEVAKVLASNGRRTVARQWSPGVMKSWLKTVQEALTGLMGEAGAASTALRRAEGNLGNRQSVRESIDRASDALDSVSDHLRMVKARMGGAKDYANKAEEDQG